MEHKDYQSTVKVLLENNCSVNTHVTSLQALKIQVFQTKENLNPPFMKEVVLTLPLTVRTCNIKKFASTYFQQSIYEVRLKKFGFGRDPMQLSEQISRLLFQILESDLTI